MKSKPVFIVLAALLLAGCAASQVDPLIEHYEANKGLVYLGQSEGEFARIFDSAEGLVDDKYKLHPKRYAVDGNLYNVRYVRTARYGDGAVTDDEFTPYVFKNGKLIAFGWEAVGGAKYTSRDVAVEKQRAKEAEALRKATSGGDKPFKAKWCNSKGMTITCS